MKMICRSYRVRRFRWACRLAPVLLLVALPAGMWPQGMLPGTSDEPRAMPSGLNLNSVSAWVGRDYLLVPNGAGQPLESYMLGYGGGVDAGWYLPGRTTRASVNYSLGYNGNSTYSELNGFDHRLSFSWTRILTRSLSLSLTGAGESSTVAGFLFQQVTSSTPNLSDVGALSNSLTPAGTAGATQTILYPGRRQTAGATATISYSPSRRFTWHASVHGQRLLPSTSYDSSAQGTLGYLGETDGGADLSLSYSLSRRTRFGAELGYFRTASRLGTTQAGSGGLTVTRVLSRRWFGSAMAGYGLGDYFVAASNTTTRRPDFTGRATLGTSFDAHTISLSAAQRIGDSYGFGAQHTMEGNLAWTWHSRRQKWSFQATAAYERLTGLQVDKIQSAVFRAAVTRRLTGKLSCTGEGGYTWGISLASASLGRQTQNGARFSIVWHPAGLVAVSRNPAPANQGEIQ
jgi:hypothetical protein